MQSDNLPARGGEDEFELRILEIFQARFGDLVKSVVTLTTYETPLGISQDIRLIPGTLPGALGDDRSARRSSATLPGETHIG